MYLSWTRTVSNHVQVIDIFMYCRWQDAADAYLGESWRRNVMFYVNNDAKLGFLDTPKDYRLEYTSKATVASRKLLAFQVIVTLWYPSTSKHLK